MAAPSEVRAALDRVLACDGLRNAGRLTRFLRFTVEKALAGEAAELKEYLIGVEVYDRGADFDPRVDPIVRVEARRLRAKLLEYYDGPGLADPVRITLPKGGYVPVFEHAAAAPVSRRRWAWLSLAMAGLAGAIVTFGSRPPSDSLSIVVVPGAEPQEAEFADGLAEAVSAELSRSPKLKVVAWPVFTEYRQRHGGSPATTLRQTAMELRAEAVLFVSVRRSGQRLRIIAHLMNPVESRKRWAGDFERGVNDGFAVQKELARAICDELVNGLARTP